jgi:hypothetical protein
MKVDRLEAVVQNESLALRNAKEPPQGGSLLLLLTIHFWGLLKSSVLACTDEPRWVTALVAPESHARRSETSLHSIEQRSL